jgi:RNA-binding protein
MALTSKQRQYLKGLAHSMEPIVRVGQHGVTEGVTGETKRSLLAHELIKVRIDATGDAKRELAEKLAASVDAEIAGLVGKMAILYRARDEDPKIKLPK